MLNLAQILIIAGPVGSGKTITSLMAIVRYLCQGATVTTNIALHWDKVLMVCALYYGRVPEQSQYIFLENVDGMDGKDLLAGVRGGSPEQSNLLVLDECGVFAPQAGKDSRDSTLKVFLDFVVHCRKHCIDCMFIVQHEKNITPAIRRQANLTCWHVDCRRYPGPIGMFFRLLHWHRIKRTYCTPGSTDAISQDFFAGNSDWYACYDTRQLHAHHYKVVEAQRVPVRRASAKDIGGRESNLRAGLWACGCLCAVCTLGCFRNEKKALEKAAERWKAAAITAERNNEQSAMFAARILEVVKKEVGKTMAANTASVSRVETFFNKKSIAPITIPISSRYGDETSRGGWRILVSGGRKEGYGSGDYLPTGEYLDAVGERVGLGLDGQVYIWNLPEMERVNTATVNKGIMQ